MSKHISSELRRAFAKRANFVCEYCLIAEEDSYFRHQIEHIISLKHAGSSESENLAFSCVHCNRNKGSDIASISATTQEIVRLFNPRTDRWQIHFRLEGVIIKSNSEIADVTISILQMNSDDRIAERLILQRTGRYPSNAALSLITDH